jgi:hypothetical protein
VILAAIMVVAISSVVLMSIPSIALVSISSMLSMDFVSQEHGVPRDGPKDSNAGG